MKNKLKLPKNHNRHRNFLHNHPILTKGGVHKKSNKSKRCLEKVKMKKEWLPQNIFYKQYISENLFFCDVKIESFICSILLLQTI